MKKLLFINGHLNAGGCERSLTDLLKHINYQKYEVDLLLLEDLGDYYAELPKEVNVLFYPLTQAFGPLKKSMFEAIKRRDLFSIQYRLIHLYSTKYGKEKIKLARRLFKKAQNHYDAVIGYRPGVCSEFAAYVFSAEKRISWWHHGELNLSASNVNELNRVYRKCDTIVAVSDSSAEIVKEYFSNAENKTVVIPNMVCIEELKITAKEFIPYKKHNSTIDIVTVGRMSPEKNMRMCSKVGRLLRKKNIDFKWYIIGDGDEMRIISRDIEENNLTDCFVLTGRLENPYPYIAKADVLVHPSTVESQGLTVLEAMALDTPVVVVESKGPKEYIRNGVNGFLVPNSPAAVCEVIENKVKNNNEQLVQCARKTVDMFSPISILKKFEDIV